jgi:methanogenic corrinoid protein MtbC1
MLIRNSNYRPDLIALSATMPAHLTRLTSTIAAIRDGSNLPIMVGGYLFQQSPGLVTRMAVDGYAGDAQAALAIADGLLAHRGHPHELA